MQQQRSAIVITLTFLMLVTGAVHGQVRAQDTRVEVTSNLRGFDRFSTADKFGHLTYMGGLTLNSDNSDFGGFSGLEVSRDGKKFLSVSDGGHWFSGEFVYKDNKLVGVTNTSLAPILNTKGEAETKKSRVDAETVAAWNEKGLDGKVIVGFERRERVEQFNIGKRGLGDSAERIKSPKAMSEGKTNGELEALGRFYEGPLNGWLIAISERNMTSEGNIRGWLWRKNKTHEFHIPAHKDFLVTGLAILPGGEEIVTVERSFTPPVLVGMVIRRFRIKDLQNKNTGQGELLFEGMLTKYQIDNMEGIGAHVDDRGTILTVISDDNFNTSVQSTVMFQFRLDQD